MLLRYRWKSRPDVAALETQLDALRSELIRLRSDLTNKSGYAAKLELALRQRTQTIDALRSRIEQLQQRNRDLDAECEHLADMVRIMPQLDAML
jgi:chromosome segregation ATPase